MPRPNVPHPKDVIAIAKGLLAEGITTGKIRCADGTEIHWSQDGSDLSELTPLEKWRGTRNATT